MTHQQIYDILRNKKINAKDKSIALQLKLFELNIKWSSDDTTVKENCGPYFFIHINSNTSLYFTHATKNRCINGYFEDSHMTEIDVDTVLKLKLDN